MAPGARARTTRRAAFAPAYLALYVGSLLLHALIDLVPAMLLLRAAPGWFSPT